MALCGSARRVSWARRWDGSCFFFFFNDTATTEIYTLSLHDALPIYMQNTRFKLAEVATTLTVGRAFIDRCVEQLVAGTLDTATASMAKLWGSEAQGRVLDELVQLHGRSEERRVGKECRSRWSPYH